MKSDMNMQNTQSFLPQKPLLYSGDGGLSDRSHRQTVRFLRLFSFFVPVFFDLSENYLTLFRFECMICFSFIPIVQKINESLSVLLLLFRNQLVTK